MADDTAHARAPQRSAHLDAMERLLGTWKVSEGAEGTSTYEWLEGRFFLIQKVDLERYGQRVRGIEIIGHEHPFGAEASEDIKSRFYDNMGNTIDYMYDVHGDTLIIWGGEKGSPAYYKRRFSPDGNTLTGEWDLFRRRIRIVHDRDKVAPLDRIPHDST